MAMAFDALRVGHTYRITNYGETREFTVMRRLSNQNYLVKDSISLEQYELAELVRWGIGKDYDLDEINSQGHIR
ncbi:hypothetical protein [Cesiribacter andamanensis]|uniref:Uncharacterized protein n=1 Tax=Cesiribacter andamanensis AMV16 TaxID=1279009 RepID=M7P0H8_9BACT|nr:hypothetical protein [Cesiribacter andamanensis]EMR04104.1 hypothetical protein ADICEAN_00727 [Cesiribacter andamanensis AMV16]